LYRNVTVTLTEPAAITATKLYTIDVRGHPRHHQCNGRHRTYTGTGIFTQSVGTVVYTVTDANGCTGTVTVTLTEPAAITATETHTPIACNGGTSTVTISATGGTAPYTAPESLRNQWEQ